MEITEMDSFSHVQQTTTRKTGSVIIRHGRNKQLVTCSDLRSKIIIPHTRKPKTKMVTIESTRLTTNVTMEQQLMTDTDQIDRLVNYNGTSQAFEAMEETKKHARSLYVSNWKDWPLLIMAGQILIIILNATCLWKNREKIAENRYTMGNANRIF